MFTDNESGTKVNKEPMDNDDSRENLLSRFPKKFRERLGSLFTDIERLSFDTASATPEIRLELDALRTRLHKLEKEILESKETIPMPPVPVGRAPEDAEIQLPPSAQEPAPLAGPILYEREQIGFAYSDNKLLQVRDAGALSKNPCAISAPLMVSGEPIGKVQLASRAEKDWAPEETEIVNAVAQQVSQQIQSLRLLAETERARGEAENATRRFMHEGWASYLDAVHQNERIGYAYDQASVAPFNEQLKLDGGVQEMVSVMDEQVGAVYLTPAADRPLTEADREMISSVADQIAQQVENIRLLADASRARAEADEVVKRITRESWESFTARNEEGTLGFVYDTNQVTPMGDWPPADVALTLPLQVRGETVGQLAVTGSAIYSQDAAELANAIAEQTSTHLETLRLNEELQTRAAELEMAVNRLRELDRLKSSFLANMSHELRTPLNSILGFTDVIMEELDGPLTENMQTDLGLIQKNGQHLLHLINDVLDMAKIEAGRMNLNPEKFRVHEILDDVTSITSTLASEKNLSLFIEPDSDRNVEIIADRTRLRQVMINLVNNSIKFTDKGKISLRASRVDGHVLISVKDTGIGIPDGKLEEVFAEFAQVDTSTTRKAGGTGLGLPISRKLIEMHGGRLWAESSGMENEGSTFFVELPLEAQLTEPVEKLEK
jgi:signal transduction histidine kinase